MWGTQIQISTLFNLKQEHNLDFPEEHPNYWDAESVFPDKIIHFYGKKQTLIRTQKTRNKLYSLVAWELSLVERTPNWCPCFHWENNSNLSAYHVRGLLNNWFGTDHSPEFIHNTYWELLFLLCTMKNLTNLWNY